MNEEIKNEGTVDQNEGTKNAPVKEEWSLFWGWLKVKKPKSVVKFETDHPVAARNIKIGAAVAAGGAVAYAATKAIKANKDGAKDAIEGLNCISGDVQPALTDHSAAETLEDLTEAVADVTDSVVDVQEVSGI